MTIIGVDVTTSLRSGPSNAGVVSGRFQIAGLAQKGPVGSSTVLKSIAEFESVYGTRTAYNSAVYDVARTFWEEGGSELVMTRVVGPAATSGLVTLMDQAGTPLPTLKVEAKNPGTASDTYNVTVSAGTQANTFNFVLKDGATVLSSYSNNTSPADLVSKAVANPYVKITSMGSATAAPQNNPANVSSSDMSAGTDDRAAVTSASYITALDNGGAHATGGAVAVPGFPADIIGVALAAHAKAHNKIALLSMDADDELAGVIAAGELVKAAGNGDAAGLFYPHLIIPDGTSTRTVEPTGYVAAARARAHRDVGFWQNPAGDPARVRWALGTNVVLDTLANNNLADFNINGIVTTGNRVRLYNWTSLSEDRDNLANLKSRDSLNNLSALIEQALEPYVFGELDGKRHLLAYIESAAHGVLDPISKRNGFFWKVDSDENIIDKGYRVVVDAPLGVGGTPPTAVLVSVAVRLSPSAELIRVEIVKVALQASV